MNTGAYIGIVEDDGPGGNGQSYLRVIGTLDQRDSERINHVARPQLAGAFRPRGGPRVGSRRDGRTDAVTDARTP